MLNESLMDNILSRENLLQAHRVVVSNKGGPGIDGMNVEGLAEHMRQHWPLIKNKLQEASYQPGLIKGVRIPKASGGDRLLGIPTVQDRLIQQALQQQMNKVYDPLFSEHSYGFRPNRSAHDAVSAAQAYIRAGKDWVIDLDISAFFDQVNHDILMTEVGRQIKDKSIMKLIGKYLRVGIVIDGKIHKRQKGTPQGGPLSPLLANIYLDKLDKELEARGLSFCRYADDINIYVSSERSAERVYESITLWIAKHLRLEVNPDKSGTGRPWQRKFLGFSFTEQGEIIIADSSMKRYKEKVRLVWNNRSGKTKEETLMAWKRYVVGWWNYFKLGINNMNAISSWTRRHMRKFLWQRWHNSTGRRNALQRLGATPWQLKKIDLHGKAWRSARTPIMHRLLNNGRLLKSHFITPSDLTMQIA